MSNPGFSQADRLELVRRYTPTETAPGKDVRVEFGNLPQLDSQGRRKFLTGFMIKARVRVSDAAQVNGTDGRITAYDSLGYFRNFRLRALGIPVFEGDIDARHLQDDVRYRLAERAPQFIMFGVPEDERLNLDDEYEVEIFWPFGDPWNRTGSRKNDCAVPLAAMDHRRDGTSVLEFRMGPLPHGGADNELEVLDLAVYALTRAELEPIVGALPRLIEVRQTQLHDAVDRSDISRDARLEYAVIRHRTEDHPDAEDQVPVAEYYGITVRHGQDQWLTAMSGRDANLALRALYDPAAFMALPDSGYPVGWLLMNTIPLVATIPGSDIADGAAYPLLYDLQDRGDYAFTRTLRRERITLRDTEAAAMAILQGVPRALAVPEVKAEKFAASTITKDFVTRRIKLAPPAPAPRRLADKRARRAAAKR